MLIFELDLDLSWVPPLAPAQQQAAVIGRFLNTGAAGVIMELLSFSIPLDLNGLEAKKIEFKDCIVPYFNSQGLCECIEVIWLKSRWIWTGKILTQVSVTVLLSNLIVVSKSFQTFDVDHRLCLAIVSLKTVFPRVLLLAVHDEQRMYCTIFRNYKSVISDDLKGEVILKQSKKS